MRTRMLIFGDSITWGYFDESGGWAARLKKYFDNETFSREDKANVYVLGVANDTTENLLNRFENEIKARLEENRHIQILIAIGLNDTQIAVQDKRNKVDIATFKKNIQTLITQAQKYTDDIIFVGLTPVDERKVNPLDRNPMNAFVNTEVAKYNQALKEVTKENTIGFIDTHDMILKNSPYEEFLSDGLHPNSHGHELIYNEVLKFIQAKKTV